MEITNGKILLVGGYTILEQCNYGIVCATNAKFTCSASILDNGNYRESILNVNVVSKKYNETYIFSFDKEGRIREYIGVENRYVKQTIQILIEVLFSDDAFFTIIKGKYIHIEIDCDNEFLLKKDNGEIVKTGLGSSAALVSALTNTVLKNISNTYYSKEQIHTIAQYIHSTIQGKIGSGFDVCASIYGSILYSRFTKSKLETLTSIPLDHFMKPFILPNGYVLKIGVHQGGTSSVNMTNAVLFWKENSDGILWELLKNKNNELCNLLLLLNHDRELQIKIKKLFYEIRSLLFTMGQLSKVDIEPLTQKIVCDQTMMLEDVLLSGIGGAGGYDAIFAIVIGEDDSNVNHLWKKLNISILQ